MNANYRFTNRAWLIKIRILGIFNQVLIVTTLIIILLAARTSLVNELNPKTVHVDSYKRSDGTKVRSYYRRRPGAAQEDSDEEFGLGLITIAIIPLFIYELFLILTIIQTDPLKLVKSYNLKLDVKDALPKPYTGNFIEVRARKKWICKKCKNPINHGEVYFLKVKDYNKAKYCLSCKIEITTYKQNYLTLLKQQKIDNQNKISKWQSLVLNDYEMTYKIKLNDSNKLYLKKNILDKVHKLPTDHYAWLGP